MEPSTLYMPAEWEPHAATWLTWPKDPLTWPDRVFQAQEVFAQMMEALTPHEKVNLLLDDEKAETEVREKLKSKKIVWKNLLLHQIPTVDSWIRDYGPIFVKTSPSPRPSPQMGEGEKQKIPSPSTGEGQGEGDLLILDFIFNAWGNKYKSLKADDTIPQKISPLLKLPLMEPGIVLEGGSIDVNGKGTLLTTEQCLLNKNRNPHLSKTEIENTLKKYLGVTNILWLGEGIAGDDTDGHVDDITRFVSADTVVTAIEEDPADENYKPLQENLKRLKKMKDQNGKALNIISLPMPGAIMGEDHRLPASYANFYIANNVVLTPIYQHKNDAVALQILQKVFSTRRIIGIVCKDLIWGMGAIHCVTQQQPQI